MNYRTIPALAAYIDRIGAEELNFRKFIVRTFKGNHYYIEKSLITINSEGDITCSKKEHAPTAAEAAAIKQALLRVEFPSCIKATEANFRELERMVRGDSKLYKFYARDAENSIVMVQERATINGRKAYLPWTYWSDATWRRMEPEQALPFWKPRQSRNSTRYMVHEGAKTAEFVDDLCNNPERSEELAAHPWGEELKQYEHWGLIGGALAPHRADYNELIKVKPSEVVYVCDNDYPGEVALKGFSKCYGHSLKGIMFDKRWRPAWDLADPMPENMFTAQGRWIGPTLLSLRQFATWATEIVPNLMGSGRPMTVIRSEFAEEWFHCVTPEVFIHKEWSELILSADEFNNKVKPFSDVDDTARLLKSDIASKTAVLRYVPAMKSGIFTDASGQRFINTHRETPIRAEKGDATPWIDFLTHLIPDDKDRTEMMRWVATLIARPDIKMNYGVLLISEVQGIGKGTLGEKILAPLVGESNASYPSESDVVESAYNYWAAHKRLAVIHEIYAGHSSKAYNKLKSVITDRYLTVSKKYQATYEIENSIHIFACSNSFRAIQLTMDDRRWFVPKVTEQKRPSAYWQNFNAWLTNHGGLGIIKHWASEWLRTNEPVMAGDNAPWSSIKLEIVEEGYSPGQIIVSQFLNMAKQEYADQPIVILDVDLVRLIRDQLYEGRHNDRLERTSTIRKLAKSQGWFISDKYAQVAAWGTRAVRCKFITNSLEVSRKHPIEVATEFSPIDVTAKARAWAGV